VERPGTFGMRAALDAAEASAQAWAVVFAKSRVVRREVPLGFDPEDYAVADYDAVADYMAPFEEQAAVAPATPSGLRWRYEGDAVLFQMGRVVNAPYDDLVARVEIAAAIRIMNDYIGGSSVVVSRDERGRVLRQAERNVYLPQPNWLAFSGGSFIDVCKLEVVDYGDDRQRIAWRTVHSPNGSAVHDDGTVTFERVGAEQTRVTVRGLQQFTLPPFWAAADPWLAPAVKDSMVEESYRRFFTATLDNVEACYEGREFRAGRDREPADDEPLEQRLKKSWTVVRDLLPDRPAEAFARRFSEQAAASAGEVDEHGFRHFAGDAHDGAAAPEQPAWLDALRKWQDEWRQVVDDEAQGPRRPAGG
jgi:hypothetical protein